LKIARTHLLWPLNLKFHKICMHIEQLLKFTRKTSHFLLYKKCIWVEQKVRNISHVQKWIIIILLTVNFRSNAKEYNIFESNLKAVFLKLLYSAFLTGFTNYLFPHNFITTLHNFIYLVWTLILPKRLPNRFPNYSFPI
jgi:hypothetical protein